MRLGSFWSRVAFLVVLYWGSDSGSDREWLCSAARLSGLNPTRGVVLMPWVVMACLLLLVRALRGSVELLAYAHARLSVIASSPYAPRSCTHLQRAVHGDEAQGLATPWRLHYYTTNGTMGRKARGRGRPEGWDLWVPAIHAMCVTLLGTMTTQRLAWPCSIHSLLFSSPAWAAPFIIAALLLASAGGEGQQEQIGGKDGGGGGWAAGIPACHRTVLALMWPEIVERFAVEAVYHILSMAAAAQQ